MPNIFDFDRLYRRTVAGSGDASAVVYLDLDPIKPGRFRVLTHVTVENKTDTSTYFRLAIRRAERLHYIDELKNPIAGELAVSRSDILLGEQDIFCAELTDTHAVDELVMSAIGWEGTL
ncbi:hypothetical protein ES703_73939 [subsurface metagenome]